MRLIKTILTSVLLAACTPWVSAQVYAPTTDSSDQMRHAVLNVYDRLLKEDPTDYETYFNRANTYYRMGEYLRAIDDINNAIKHTPASNRDLLFQEYMLRGAIYQQREKYADALSDFTSACSFDPTSYAALYQKANCEYTLGQYSEAKADFSRLQRMNTRSVEALVGLARIAVKENNLGLANDYLEQAVSIDPNNADIYMRRATVRKDMGNDNGAVDDLILALSTDTSNSKALNALVDYGNTNYTAVMTGLSNAISQAPRVGMFWYLRAMIAQAHYHYTAAITDFQHIIDNNLYNYHGLYASIADCQYALGEYEKALDNVDYALNMIRDNAQYFVLRSKILRALNRDDEAVAAAASALAISPQDNDALTQMALCYVSKKQYDEANSLLGEATLNDNQNPDTYLLRAWLLETYLNQPVAASQFYQHVLDIDFVPEMANNVRTMRGFALLFLGKTDEADTWIENILAKNIDHDGLINYYAACLYAWQGNDEKALSHVEKALSYGYANYYNWTDNNDGKVNVAPIRDDLRFLNLLSRYKVIFGQ